MTFEGWWVGKDSNLRRREPSDLQSDAFNHFATYPHMRRAGDGVRTRDLLITNQLLYQLSYASRIALESIYDLSGKS